MPHPIVHAEIRSKDPDAKAIARLMAERLG